jgi:N-methylhydantoinase A
MTERGGLLDQRQKAFEAGVDVGGTFTDVLLLNRAAGRFLTAKVPSTPADQAIGFMEGIAALGVSPGELEEVLHGTTVATNALLERKGARVGLITTEGFRDLLELGRRTRPSPYGLTGSFEALVERHYRLEVPERVTALGEVLVPLDEVALRNAVLRLRDAGCEALVIHFLHAYAAPGHERRAAEIARALWPNDFVCASHEILAEMREFERGSTAAVHAYVQPAITRYVGSVTARLRDAGFRRELLLMQANGGIMAASVVAEKAVHTVLSGPAAGVIAAAAIGRAAGFTQLITGDMGGTSFDVALVQNSEPTISAEKDIAYSVPVRVPMVDLHTIGAGGGSIARVNAAGLLAVGPESAGALPGPVGYGRGGTEPTITDANLLLGRLDTARVPDGRPADLARVAQAMEKIARPLGLDAFGAAAAILRVVNGAMADAMRLVSVARGQDPRDLTYLPFGGAGPLHAVELARELGFKTILVPPFPGLTSALGCLIADLRHDFVRTLNRPIDDLDGAAIDAVLAEQAEAGRELLRREGADASEIRCAADLLFHGQTHMLQVPVPHQGATPDAMAAAFTRRFYERFGIELPEMRIMLVNLRTTVYARRPPLDFTIFAPPRDGNATPIATRRVWFADGWHETPIYDRATLPVSAMLCGPAVVEQPDTTVLLHPGSTAEVDRFGNLVVTP